MMPIYQCMIPAKTFLLGEYAALAGHPAILLTTTPCFTLSVSGQQGLHGIHPESPAGQWWLRCSALAPLGVHWQDPYLGQGGMGASSAQFIGMYRANAYLRHELVNPSDVLAAYKSIGVPGSGYDVRAQLGQACVYWEPKTACYQSYPWVFKDLGFILVHTQQKLATHHHLKTLGSLQDLSDLGHIVAEAKAAFDTQESGALLAAIQAYHAALNARGWVAAHTVRLIQQLQETIEVLAIKGCGALGADVILVIVAQSQLAATLAHLSAKSWCIVGNSEQLYANQI